MHHPQLKSGVLLRDKWKLDKFLGRGGMSSVYSATHRNGMRGAIKVLHRELNDNEVVKRRFMREGYVANKVEHPGSVKVLDDDVTEDGLVFLVMELLEGETLKRRWIDSDRRMDVALVLEIVDQILDVLESAHRNGIVHRDLKPDNIFLLANGSVKVLDFGIARVLEATLAGSADATSSAAMMGTPAFMPPEQALAHWDKVNGRADLFATAATAYTVLSGKLIHSGSTMPELLIAAATRQVDPIRAVMPELDEAVAAVLDRALRFDIGERWPDARSMRLALLQAKTQTAGSRTVKLHLLSQDQAVALVNASSPALSAQRHPAAPVPAASMTTVAPSTTPMDSTDDPTVAYAVPSPIQGSPRSVRTTEPTPTLAPAQAEQGAALVRPPATTQALRPQQGRASPRTLQSETAAERAPASSSAWDATPVRLQQPMRPEHVIRLAKSGTGETTVTTRSSKAWLTWLIGGVTAAAVIAVVVIVQPGSADRSQRGAPSGPLETAPLTTVASARASAPTVTPAIASATGQLSVAPSVAASVPASASVSASSSVTASASASVKVVPLRRPGTGPCIKVSDFNGRCTQRAW